MPVIAALLSAAALFAPVAQETPAQASQTSPVRTAPAAGADQVTDLGEVEIEARRRTAYEAARRFVDEVVETPPGRGLARWDGKVCVGVANLRREIAQPLIDRISDRIEEIGLGVGEPGCNANVLIVATDDGPGAARALVEARPRAFNPGVSGTRLSLAALERFQSSDAPVRWWRITLPVDADTGAVTVRLRGEGPAQRSIRQPSRIRTQDRNIFARIFIILDLSKAEGIDFNALGDYLAMVSMSQIGEDTDVSGYSSILNLFTDPTGTHEMSDWDRDYLRSLYAAELNERRASQQEGSVAGSMARQREPGAAEPQSQPQPQPQPQP